MKVVTEFSQRIQALGPMNAGGPLDHSSFFRKIEAAKLAFEGPKFRMALAKQARDAKKAGKYGEFPSQEKLMAGFDEEMSIFETFLHMREQERGVDELAELMKTSPDEVGKRIETLRKRNFEWRV